MAARADTVRADTVRAETVRSGSVRELDWLMGAVVLLCCLGLVMAISITGSRADVAPLHAMKEQGYKLLVGMVVFMIGATVRLSLLRRLAAPLLAVATMLCLLAVLFPDSHGARRWIRFGPVGFQPVELARFSLVLYCAAWVARSEQGIHRFRTGFLPLMGPAGALAVCLLLQPDVGNAMIALTLAAAMALVAGVRVRHFIFAGSPVLVALLFAVVQRGYVQERLSSFLDIQQGSQVWQSLVAISSGGVIGRGLGEGWMKMGFVPEAGNDFVFAIIGEELGLAGSLLVLGTYAVIGVIGLRLVMQLQDRFLQMLVFGLTFALCMQAAINLLVVTGMAPAKGIDLPFLSSGGTNLVFSLGAIGIIGNAARSDRAGAP